MNRKFAAVFTSYLAVLLYHSRGFLSVSEFAGRDLVGAYSLVEVFGSGWSMEWFLGFPLFRFYPPGFFFTADMLGALVGDIAAFKLMSYIPMLLFPLAVYYCFRGLFDTDTALVSLVLSFAVVFLREPVSLLYQTLQVGLVVQMAALPLLFIYIRCLWRSERGSGYMLAAVTALMVLFHPYIAAVAVLYLGIFLVLERNVFGLLASSTGLLLTAWWWIPVLEKNWYMQLYTGPTGKLLNWPWMFLPLAFLDRSRRTISLVSLAVILLIFGTFDLGLSIQFYRFYIYGQIFAVLAAAPGLVEVMERLSEKTDGRYLFAALAVAFIAPSVAVDVSPEWRSDVELEEVVPEDGRVIVETSHSDLYNSYVPIQQIPLRSNVTVVNGLYADQSISSPYLLGLEKTFAENPVPNPIAVEANLTSEQLEERFRYFGIDYALVRTEHAERKLSFMQPVSSNEDFVLLKHNYSRPDYEPVVVKGSYKEWEELNRRIFRGELRPAVYTPEDKSAIPISNLSTGSKSQEMDIRTESIRPVNRSQAVFGLRIR